jgi:hypothetical protein
MNPQMQKAIEEFFATLDNLTDEFGEAAVLSALELVVPSFDMGPLEQNNLQENSRTTLLELSQEKKQKILAALGLTGAGGTVTGLVGGAVSGIADIATREIDQDISIDDITTDKALNVTDQAVQDTNDALQTMIQILTQTQQQLSDKLDAIDVSVDDSIAAETGESADQVQTRQNARLTRPETSSGQPDGETEKTKKGKSKSEPRNRPGVRATA